MVTWEVTNACNLRCPHCYNKSGIASDSEINTQDAFSLIDMLADAQVLRLLITGGEPFLRPDIVPILRKASETKMRLDIATNGVVLPKKALNAMRELPVFHVHVSIDGIGEPHDIFRGKKGAYDEACKNIHRLIDENITVSLSTTVTKNNLYELEDIVELALDLGCSGFFANAMLPAGRGADNVDRFRMDTNEYKRMYKILVDKSKELKGRLAISTDMCFPFLFASAPVRTNSDGRMGCSAGLDTLCIGADGTAYPCHLLRDMPLGNILDMGIRSLWKDPPALRELRDLQKKDMKEPCHSCRFAPHPCVGGCRAAAYLEHGDLRAMDPTCFIQISGANNSHCSKACDDQHTTYKS
jgi:radical SAM protein with 4Fe4S-binding SPASM domain